MARIIVGITGASGTVLGYRAVDVLTKMKYHVDLVMSRDACLTAAIEMGSVYNTVEKIAASFSDKQRKLITIHKIQDFNASIASGSYIVDGMIIVPCSMATLSAVAIGLSDNLLRRAADVTLKEKRPLVIVPRETPLSEIHLENMLRIARMGGSIVPPIPCWYNQPKTLKDMEDFIVGRALDALKIHTDIYRRWKQ